VLRTLVKLAGLALVVFVAWVVGGPLVLGGAALVVAVGLGRLSRRVGMPRRGAPLNGASS
jgi:hypothetical protein